MAELLVISYDATSGSDTAASGAGPTTAITGSSATNGAGNVVDLSGSPDLSGVAVSDVIWCNSASGQRHLSRITAVNDGADTVTTEDLLVLGAGVSWAIGGERKTLINDTTSRPDWDDFGHGWTIEFDEGVYNVDDQEIQSVNSGNDAIGWQRWQAKPDLLTMPEIRHNTHESRLFDVNASNTRMLFIGLDLTNESTWGGGDVIKTSGSAMIIRILCCKLRGRAASGGGRGVEAKSSSVIDVVGCYFGGQLTVGFYGASGGRTTGQIKNNWFDGSNGSMSHGVTIPNPPTYTSREVVNNLVTECTSGILVNCDGNTSMVNVYGNTVFDCTDGISIEGDMTSGTCHVEENLVVGCDNAITCVSGSGYAAEHSFSDYNAVYDSATAHWTNITQGANDIILSADPFVDSATNDFRLNNTAGGGAACRAATRQMLNSSPVINFKDIGAFQHEDSGGGGAASILGQIGLNGGMQ